MIFFVYDTICILLLLETLMQVNHAIVVRLPAELKAWLEHVAKANSRSLSGEVMHMVKERFEAALATAPNHGRRHDADVRP